ncbi:Deformed epidermal autoregulatory factor 1 homolog (Nuclear DEAF-1-related transcriptional regulator) (NUDR) [Durusdinium trenchii]|uniref:Deformed epidermal autoregulatory factor 1 homolog (Nuclear DEAF-1-related transcriptional regulator) (NUDR) n=1 Tax=Durusdinium trenchii TaxID=1381693 RepID=A0ABP0RPB4_9DINO
MPNAELSSRSCDQCGRVGALLQCGKCKQVAYCNFSCQKIGWKEHKRLCGQGAPAPPSPSVPSVASPQPAEVPKQEAPRWREQGPPANAALPRQNPSLGAFKAAKLEDFFDRTDLDCGLAPLGEKKKPNGTGDRLDYSKWANLADSDDDVRKSSAAGAAARPKGAARQPMFGQAMGAEAVRGGAGAAGVPGVSTRPTAQQRSQARDVLDEAEKLLHQVAGEVLYQAGFMGHGSVWELGPAAEKVARKCLRLLDTKVLPVLEDDVLAKFLHGSAHYFLRKAMSATETEQRTASRTAKAKLMEVYRDQELREDYRENACEFLSALFHEAGEADKAQDVLKGLSVDVEQVSTSVNGINGHANGGADAKAQPKATSAGDSRWAWRQRREPKSVEAPEEVPVAKPSPKQEVISAKLKEAPSKSSGIPSIDEVLARLDLEEQQEQETY